MQEIVTQTNRYALRMSLKQRPANYRQEWPWPPSFLQRWKELTVRELEISLALVYAFGVHSLPSNWLLETPQFRACMSRDRFRQIKACLHLLDDEMLLLNPLSAAGFDALPLRVKFKKIKLAYFVLCSASPC